MRRDDQRQAVKNIPLEQLKPFKNHPFQVRDDEEFRRLVESIGIYGVIHPAVARQIGENCYELISGHRRKAACEVLGYASLFSSHSSGSCTRIKRRFPPSSALSCITAWAVVAEPEKKSRMMSSVLDTWETNCLITSTGFGKSNKYLLNNPPISLVAVFV